MSIRGSFAADTCGCSSNRFACRKLLSIIAAPDVRHSLSYRSLSWGNPPHKKHNAYRCQRHKWLPYTSYIAIHALARALRWREKGGIMWVYSDNVCLYACFFFCSPLLFRTVDVDLRNLQMFPQRLSIPLQEFVYDMYLMSLTSKGTGFVVS